jgi:hypothetical protein
VLPYFVQSDQCTVCNLEHEADATVIIEESSFLSQPHYQQLTPKGPLVPKGTNRFWAASYDLTLFLDFLKLFVKMRLGISFT